MWKSEIIENVNAEEPNSLSVVNKEQRKDKDNLRDHGTTHEQRYGPDK